MALPQPLEAGVGRLLCVEETARNKFCDFQGDSHYVHFKHQAGFSVLCCVGEAVSGGLAVLASLSSHSLDKGALPGVGQPVGTPL